MTVPKLATFSEAPMRRLEEAFEHFTRSSAMLQEKYESLAQESERLREQLRQKEEQIQRTERLATLGKTAAAMAHEIRNPLGAMKLFASLLRDDLADRPNCLEMLQHLETSIGCLDHVVSNILQFAKSQEPGFAPVNLHGVVREQIQELRGRAPEVEVRAQLSGNPFVHANEHSLRQVLRNLLLNAAEAMGHQGSIDISAADDGDGVQLTIADSGPGIPLDLLPRIFEPFVTSRNEGTGLGLAIVHQIIAQHGGSVTAEPNSPLGGAAFRIVLPRVARTAGGPGRERNAGSSDVAETQVLHRLVKGNEQ